MDARLLTDVELPDGDRFEHHVIKLRAAAMVVLIDDQDRVLMMWRHRFVSDRWGWEIPGGLVDEGEDPEETALRELLEETGYRPKTVRHVTRFQPMVGMVDSWHDVFVGEGAQKVANRPKLPRWRGWSGCHSLTSQGSSPRGGSGTRVF